MTPADTIALLDRIVADVERLRAMLTRSEGGRNAETPQSDPLLSEDDLIDVASAAERFDLPQERVRRWCREGCGVKRGGRHLASITQFRRRLRNF